MSLVGTRPPTVDENWCQAMVFSISMITLVPLAIVIALCVMLPFTFLLMWTAKEKLLKEKGRQICFTSILWYSTKVAFLFSLTIEFLQLFLRLGTFQLSDLCYNTLGGAMGGVLYWMGWKVKK